MIERGECYEVIIKKFAQWLIHGVFLTIKKYFIPFRTFFFFVFLFYKKLFYKKLIMWNSHFAFFVWFLILKLRGLMQKIKISLLMFIDTNFAFLSNLWNYKIWIYIRKLMFYYLTKFKVAYKKKTNCLS